MAASMDIQKEDFIEYNFGRCHFTWPVLQELVKQRPNRVRQIITNLRKELGSEPRVRRFQKLNLLGFCLFENGDKIGARELFDNILTESSENLNALKNLAFVLRNLGGNETRIKEITGKVTQLLTVTKDRFVGKVNALKAEQIAEEASAYGTFDQHQTNDGTLAMRIRRKAIEMGEKEADPFLYKEWKYGLAFDLARLDNLCIKEGIETETYFEDAARLCYSIVSEKTDGEEDDDTKILKAKVWSRLGDLVNRKKERSLKKLFNSRQKLDDLNIFLKAMVASTNHPYVLRTLAECYRNEEDYESALESFNKSIEGEKGEDMWWARNRRGRTYLSLYQESVKLNKPNSVYLDRAEKDMRRSLEMYSMHYVFVDLAKVLMCKGSTESLEEALELCIKVGRLKGGANNKELYEVMKEIFSQMGKTDVDEAFKQTEGPFSDFSKDADWTQLDRIDCLVLHSSSPPAKSCVDEIKKKFECYKSIISISDVAEQQELENTIGSCQKVIIVMTEELANGVWLQKSLECKSMKERLARHCVLPIFLDREIPNIPDAIKDEYSILKKDDNKDGEVFWNLVLEFLAVPPPFLNSFKDIKPALEFLAEKATIEQVILLCRKVFEFHNTKIEDIQHNHSRAEEQKIQLLFHWVTKKGDKASLGCLISGLKQIELNHLADQLNEKFSTKHV